MNDNEQRHNQLEMNQKTNRIHENGKGYILESWQRINESFKKLLLGYYRVVIKRSKNWVEKLETPEEK